MKTTIKDEKRKAANCIDELQSYDRPLFISYFTNDNDNAADFGSFKKQGHDS